MKKYYGKKKSQIEAIKQAIQEAKKEKEEGVKEEESKEEESKEEGEGLFLMD